MYLDFLMVGHFYLLSLLRGKWLPKSGLFREGYKKVNKLGRDAKKGGNLKCLKGNMIKNMTKLFLKYREIKRYKDTVWIRITVFSSWNNQYEKYEYVILFVRRRWWLCCDNFINPVFLRVGWVHLLRAYLLRV